MTATTAPNIKLSFYSAELKAVFPLIHRDFHLMRISKTLRSALVQQLDFAFETQIARNSSKYSCAW
jgi:hypothetical protein